MSNKLDYSIQESELLTESQQLLMRAEILKAHLQAQFTRELDDGNINTKRILMLNRAGTSILTVIDQLKQCIGNFELLEDMPPKVFDPDSTDYETEINIYV
jgi:hypothetical protein